MRYTTIIDITEMPGVWRNKNAAHLYLFLALRSGYHDKDRDIITISIRDIAWQLHISVAAVRHALGLLRALGLIEPIARSQYKVTKWVDTQEVSRRRTKREREMAHADAIRRKEQEEREAQTDAVKKAYQQAETPYHKRLKRLKALAEQGDEYAIRQLKQLEKL